MKTLSELLDSSSNVLIRSYRKKYFYICAKAFMKESHLPWTITSSNLKYNRKKHTWLKPIVDASNHIVSYTPISSKQAKILSIKNYWTFTNSTPALVKYYNPNKKIDAFETEANFHLYVNNKKAHLKGWFIRIK